MIQISERIGKLLEYLEMLVYTDKVDIDSYKMIKTETKFDNLKTLDTSKWSDFNRREIWGGHEEYFWFETVVTIPENYEGKCVVYELLTGREAFWDATNPQFSIYVNGQLIQGLDVNHRSIILSERAEAGEKFRIILSAFTGVQNFSLHINSCLKVLHRDVEKYFYDISVPYNVAKLLPSEDTNKILILKALNNSLNLVDMRQESSENFYTSILAAEEDIQKNFYEKYCRDQDLKVYCVGHTHIDCAWLWTLKVTEDKSVRSFSTVLNLMNEYPEYTFMSSQPQLYKYVKKNNPELFKEIQRRVAEGRWEVDGGMFVEADCNIASGEALIRQFVHGKKFFKDEFNKDNEILWLPDVFGYSAALPQIIKKCGLSYFMTTKLSWNEFNKMPYDTFEWEGIDGTKVLTHFVSIRDYNTKSKEGSEQTEHFTTYNAYINPSQIKGGWERYSQKDLNNEILCCYGFGDGGGGPTKDMLENKRRLSKGIPGCPQTVDSTAKEFFHVLEKNVKNSKYLPNWVGELYLEYHRGTYTGMARNKRYNRKSEFSYQNAECYSSIANVLTGKTYPSEEIYEAWEVILRNQFHDILPGSSIHEVYEDSKVEYEKIKKINEVLVDDSLTSVVDNIEADKNSLVVFNPNSFEFNGLVELDCDDVISDSERLQKIDGNRCLVSVDGIPSKGYRAISNLDSLNQVGREPITITKDRMENDFFRIEFNAKGQFSSIFDKRESREILKKGEMGNVIISYEDRPHNYDAWDLNKYYDEKQWEVDDLSKWEVIEIGPLRGCIKISRDYLDSTIVQYIYIYRDIDRIDIKNEIDWHEHQIFLKTWFPLDVHTNEASFDIQYGNVKRNTHNNTSWDYAQFEVCMHKWLDVSEYGFGVSFLNDCKYGCSVKNSNVSLSMLKSGVYPNPTADQEHHEFTYSIYPHKDEWRKSELIKNAYEINNPAMPVVKKSIPGKLPSKWSFVSTDKENVVIEVVKEATESTDTIIRLYECYNLRTDSTLKFGRPIKSIYECDMMENNISELKPVESNEVEFEISPYEIKTFRVVF
ncbi:MAG: glycosyl hydrolase-related protein [Sphaerochaetaceae bacterium]|nr:glycosyl hydrolase-related protein [Sphaerochaetaceae bacterium]